MCDPNKGKVTHVGQRNFSRLTLYTNRAPTARSNTEQADILLLFSFRENKFRV